ncbi:MAG: peptide ABC transporter substrate-binding protein [Dehalococcoidia bacterium]|nr:peptide ABC transporter substrate-binding protein [Dehalococcoidia bacterium]
MSKHVRMILPCVALIVVLVSGCGIFGRSGTTTAPATSTTATISATSVVTTSVSTTTTSIASATTTASVTSAPTTTTATPDLGGTGTLNLYGSDPLTLDPAQAGDSTSNSYVNQIFSGLIKLDDRLEPAGDLALDWQVSPDGLVYTFNLRRDAVFHDGRALTASDVKYSWERALSPAIVSQTASTYLGDILGASAMLSGAAQSLAGVRVVDDYTLEVTLAAPSAAFLPKMSYATAMVVDKNQTGAPSWWKTPNGSGPFKLAVWREGSELVLERNALYYGDRARLEKVVFKLLAGLPMDLYESGQIDVADVSIIYYDRVTDPAGSFSGQLVITPELSLTYLGFDTTRAPFNDPAIRRAFAMAVNKDRIAELMFRDVLSPANGVLPPGIPGYNDALRGIPYDVEGALALIAASSYGSAANLPPITITTGGYGGRVSGDLVAIVHDWQQAFGIEITIRQLDPMVFIYQLFEEKDNIYYWGWGADYASPQNFLEVLFGEGMSYNIGEYRNAEFNALLSEAAVADWEESLELYRRAEQLLVDDAACIPLWSGANMQLVRDYVKGYRLNAFGMVALNEVYLEG